MASSLPAILIVEDEQDIREILQIIIESSVEYPILSAKSGNHAIEVMKSHPDVGIVISDFNMPDGNGELVYKWIKSHRDGKIPFILMSGGDLNNDGEFKEFKKSHPGNSHLNKPFHNEDILEAIEKAMRTIQSDDVVSKDSAFAENFCRIRPQFFLNFPTPEFEVFIKVDQKMVLLSHAGEVLSEQKIYEFIQKGVKFVYFKRSDFESYIKFVFERVKLCTSNKNVASIEGIHNYVVNLGVSQKVCQLIQSTIDDVLGQLEKSPKLLKYIEGVLEAKNYLTAHCLLTSYFCGTCAHKSDWWSDSTLRKFCYASLFANIALDNPELAQIIDKNSEEFEILDRSDKNAVLKHAASSVELYDKIDSVESDVRKIIDLHHERPDGKGFPKGLNHSQIPPLPAIFIICSELAHYVAIKGESLATKQDIMAILDQIGPKYQVGAFQKHFKELQQAIGSEK